MRPVKITTLRREMGLVVKVVLNNTIPRLIDVRRKYVAYRKLKMPSLIRNSDG